MPLTPFRWTRLPVYILCLIFGFQSLSVFAVEKLLVCDYEASAVISIDVATNVRTTIECPFSYPIYCIVNKQNTKAYVAYQDKNVISEIDLTTNGVGRVFTLPNSLSIYCGTPLALASTVDGTYLCVPSTDTDTNQDVVSMINVENGVVSSYDLGTTNNWSFSVAASPDGSYIYIVSSNYTSMMLRFSTIHHTVDTIPFNGSQKAFSIAVTEDGAKAYVCARDDTRTFALLANLAAGSPYISGEIILSETAYDPMNICLSPDGARAYVTFENSTPNGVQIINTTNDSVGPFVDLFNPFQVAVSSDSKYFFVSNFMGKSASHRNHVRFSRIHIKDGGDEEINAVLTYDAESLQETNVFEGFSIPTGLAIYSFSIPKAPRKFIGHISHHNAKKGKALLTTSWTPSTSSTVLSYRVYSKGKLLGTVPASSRPIFKHSLYSPYLFHHTIIHRYHKRLEHKYKVCAIGHEGRQSSFTRLKIKK